MSERAYLGLVIFLQAIGAIFFAGQIILSLLGIPMRPVPWQFYELLEIIAAISLGVGVAFGVFLLSRSIKQRDRVRRALRAASSAFHDLMQQRFTEWGLSDAEKDVALFAVKGMNTSEIAAIRNTTEGTIKAQSASIYRKSGVNSRSQLVSLFLDELFDTTL